MNALIPIPRKSSVWLLVLFVFLATGLSEAAERQVLRGHVPAAVVSSLKAIRRLPETNELDLAIGLPFRNKEALTRTLEQIYDPASPDYRHYLTPEQFAERFGPTEADYQAVIDFAKRNGLVVTGKHSNRAFLEVRGKVADVEKALQIKLQVYPHPKEARSFFAPEGEPSLDLSVPVLAISGLNDFLRPKPKNLRKIQQDQLAKTTPKGGSAPNGSLMGNDFRAAYVPGVSLDGSGQVVGLLEFDGYYRSDITAYESQAGLPDVTLQNILFGGFRGTPGDGNNEVALDIEMAISMAPGLSKVIVYEGSSYMTSSSCNSMLNRMATDNVAKQISCSWDFPTDASTEQIFQQFASQGQSFFNASGDSNAYLGTIPTPDDDPYITMVGGTTLTTSGPGGAWVSETVWKWDAKDGSSGGISATFAIPSWQQGISMSANRGSTTMRNVPDVAMAADNVFVIADNGTNYTYGGTSIAAPLWAGFVALVNQQAVSQGSPTVGFINPAVYAIGKGSSYSAAFHDITTGNNYPNRSSTRFPAVAGYDLCTGWGTPTGQSLIDALAGTVPQIMSQPQNQVVAAGSDASFSVSASGKGPLSYFWLYNGQSISQATSATLTLHNVQVSMSGAQYSCLVSNAYGTATSQSAALIVGAAPAILDQTLDQIAPVGGAATFTVDATGTAPLSYQWKRNGVILRDGSRVSGAASSALTLTGLVLVDAGSYSAVLTNPYGSTNSQTVKLGVLAKPVIMQQPAATTNVVGAPAVFHVVASGGTLSYQWKRGSAALQDDGANISGTKTDSLTISEVSLGDAAPDYSVTISNLAGTTGSQPASLSVVTAPALTQQPSDQTTVYGGKVIFRAAATGTGPLTYHWQKNGATLANVSGKISGASSSNLTVFAAGKNDPGIYTVMVSNPWGSATSSEARLSINPTVAIRSPAASLTTTNAQVEVTGTAVAYGGGLGQVVWQINGGLFQAASGLSNWTASVVLGAGSNTFAVKSVDENGFESALATRSMFCKLYSPLALSTNGAGRISGVANKQALVIGLNYKATAAAGAGQLFSNWSGSLPAGTSTNNPLTFTMQSNMVLRANFVPNPFLARAGVYNGLFYDTNGVGKDSSGFFKFTLSSLGGYSGQLTLGGASRTVLGKFDLSGQSHLVSTSKPPISVDLALDTVGDSGVSGQVAGAGWTALLIAPQARYMSPKATNYSLVLTASKDGSSNGYANVTIKPNGLVVVAGKLSDASSLTPLTAYLSKNGDWPFYSSLYKGDGLLLGWLTNHDGAFEGSLGWIKATPSGTNNDLGFTNGVDAVVSKK